MVSCILLGALTRVGCERSQAGLADVLQVSAWLPELREDLTERRLVLAVLSFGMLLVSILIQTEKKNPKKQQKNTYRRKEQPKEGH